MKPSILIGLLIVLIGVACVQSAPASSSDQDTTRKWDDEYKGGCDEHGVPLVRLTKAQQLRNLVKQMLLRKALLADKGLAVDHYDEEIAAVESRIAKAKNEERAKSDITIEKKPRFVIKKKSPIIIIKKGRRSQRKRLDPNRTDTKWISRRQKLQKYLVPL